MLHLLTALALASAPPPDEAAHTTRWRLHAEWRTTFGAALDAPLTLGFAAAGARLQLSPALSLDLLALAVLPLSGEAYAGLGGELGLRVSPLHGPVRPFLRASMGLALFGRERPFLPGADVYEGVLTWSVGLELDLGPTALAVDAHYIHLSNGQGLGPHNPAFDGFGASLGLSLPVGDAIAAAAWYDDTTPLSDRPEHPGLDLDLNAGQIDEHLYLASRLRLHQRLAPSLLAGLDLELGHLAEHPLLELGADLVLHRPLTVALHLGLRTYASIDTFVAALQVEAHLVDEVSLVALGHLEESDFAGTVGRAALGVRVFPAATLSIDLGVGFDQIGRAAFDHTDPYLGFEWAPLTVGPVTFALTLERQIAGIDLLGLRLTFDRPRTTRDAARVTSWRRVR